MLRSPEQRAAAREAAHLATLASSLDCLLADDAIRAALPVSREQLRLPRRSSFGSPAANGLPGMTWSSTAS
jgi:hypothetical protein